MTQDFIRPIFTVQIPGSTIQLGSLLSWRSKLEGISEELDGIYTDNKVIKEDVLGPRKNIEHELHQQLQQNARAVLESVNEQSDLLLGAHRLSIVEYDKASTAVRERLDRLYDQATAIDTLITRLANLTDQTKELIDRLADEENQDTL